jgi:hypothetical protein
LVLRGVDLSQNLRSEELYLDRKFTLPVPDLSRIQTGDIIGVCSRTQQKFRSIHVGIALVDGNTINLLHNAKHIGHAVIQPLDEVRKHIEHEVIAWIRRPIISNPEFANYKILEDLGLDQLTESR